MRPPDRSTNCNRRLSAGQKRSILDTLHASADRLGYTPKARRRSTRNIREVSEVATTQQQSQQAPRTQAPTSGGSAPAGGAEATRGVQGQAGNAATETRARGTDAGAAPNPQAGASTATDTANPDRANEARPSAQAAYDALSATPFVYNTFLTACAGLYRTGPAQVTGFITAPIVATQMHSRLSGAQTYETLATLRHPAPGAGRVVTWVDHLRQATSAAPAAAYASTLSGADTGDLEQLLQGANNAALSAVLTALSQDPLTLFPSQQTGLSANACASQTFMTAVVTRSTAGQVWRAIQGTPAGQHAALCGTLNGIAAGWNWLDGLHAAGLGPAEHALLSALHPLANATAQGKITTINATAGVPTPAVPFATAFTAARTAATPPTAAALRELLQTGTHAERAALFADSAKATFIFGILTADPLLELSIGPGDRQPYLEKNDFFLRVLNHTSMSWQQKLEVFCQRSYINALGPRFTANDAAVATFITTSVPALAQIPETFENDLRAITLVTTAPGIAAAIRTKFDDKASYSNHQGTGRTPDPEATQTPLQRLDALIAQTPPPPNLGASLVSMLGALGPDRTTVAADATRMTSLRTRLSDEQWFQALIDLQVSLTQGLSELRAKGHTATRIQTLVTRATPVARVLALRSDDNIAMVRADVVQDPIGFMLQGAALESGSFDFAAWRNWVLESTAVPKLLDVLAGSVALATSFAPKLDAASAWGWLARVPDGAALSVAEKNALDRLRAATSQPPIAAQIRAKTTAVTAPAHPGVAPGPVGPPGPVAPPATKLQQLQSEVAAAAPNAARILQLANEVTASERGTFATTERARLISILSAEQIVRFVRTLTAPIADKLGWVKDKGGTAPMSDVTALIALAPDSDRVALFDNATLITWLRGASRLGPLQTMGLNESHIAALVSKQPFWDWVLDRQTGFELLRFVGASRNIPAALTVLVTINRWTLIDNLPAGSGLPPETRDQIDTIFPVNTDAALARKLFAKRFDVATSGWAAANLDDIKRLYNDCKNLPIAHVANNPRLVSFNRGSGGGGNYQNDQIANINQDDLATTDTMYAGTPNAHTENYFDHTVRHEIGHSVDAMLGSHTSLVYNTAGWKAHTLTAMDSWITAMDGWNAGGGATPTDPEKQQIRDLITQLVQSGGGTISGPNMGAPQLAPTGHPFQRYPQLKIVELLSRNAGTMVYVSPNRVVANGKVFSINYYYRQFMECTTNAGLNVPRDYCMFSPAEWFADMYAEYYRAYNGRDDGTLGGNCPGFVKTWFYQNVHLLGGRTPSDLHGRPRPRGQAVHA